jgi:prevent-host-death family protein
MSTVGAYQAKTQLASLLDRVEKGEHITITRHGRAVAMLVPPSGGLERPVEQVIADILDARRGRRLGEDLSVRDLISTGRR